MADAVNPPAITAKSVRKPFMPKATPAMAITIAATKPTVTESIKVRFWFLGLNGFAFFDILEYKSTTRFPFQQRCFVFYHLEGKCYL